MRILQNLHTHTTYCDGVNTPEEMIKAAIDKGFQSIGFSGHSYMDFSPVYSMSLEDTEKYKEEIFALKEKYRGIIDVFCGLEFEMFSTGFETCGYDYLIGSVHYLSKNGEKIGFDRPANVIRPVIEDYFSGDGLEFAKEYYSLLATLPEYGDFDIIAHFDLVTKHVEKENFFDVESSQYKEYAVAAAEALAGKIPYFEVNTGAIARGYRTSPYPSDFLLGELKRLGFKAIVSSDCHNKEYLDCGFEDAFIRLKNSGFKEYYILTQKGFKAVSLEDGK